MEESKMEQVENTIQFQPLHRVEVHLTPIQYFSGTLPALITDPGSHRNLPPCICEFIYFINVLLTTRTCTCIRHFHRLSQGSGPAR